jgi:hypothetical protein
MKKNLIKIVLAVLVVSAIIFFVTKTKAEDRPFNLVELTSNNLITNNKLPEFYDTILSVGLDQAGIKDQHIIINHLSDGAKNQFDGELRAHIRFYNGSFYLFIDELDRDLAIQVISHEIIHIKQYISGDLSYENSVLVWKGDVIDLTNVEYSRREWENEAFSLENQISTPVYQILWGK